VNDMAADPLLQAEVEKISRSAWYYEASGNNWSGREARAVIVASDTQALASGGNSDAALLYLVLRAAHGARSQRGEPFAISCSAMAQARTIAGWGKWRFLRARQALIDFGLIRLLRQGRGRGDPSLYVFVGKS
jgi:hypothetical protein